MNIDENAIHIQKKPKGTSKDHSFNRTDIAQLYIKRNPATGHYDIFIIVDGLEGQKHIKLIPNVEGKSKARYLEQEIEKYLGIIDREVLEETKV